MGFKLFIGMATRPINRCAEGQDPRLGEKNGLEGLKPAGTAGGSAF